MTELICTEPGIGIELGTTFQVLSENCNDPLKSCSGHNEWRSQT